MGMGNIRSTAVVLVALFVNAAIAADQPDWLENSMRIMKEAQHHPDMDWLKAEPVISEETKAISDNMLDRATGIAKSAVQQNTEDQTAEQSVAQASEWDGTIIFVSLSMPKSALKGALVEAHDRKALVVFRGIEKGGSINGMMERLKELSPVQEEHPTVTIDPRQFRQHKVTTVPAILMHGIDGHQYIAYGTYSIDWMRREVEKKASVPADPAQSGTISLGVYGSTYAVAERDLIEEMQERMSKVDWDAKKKAAINNFWKRQKFEDVGVAREDRTFEFDPTITVNEDVMGSEGEVIAAAGTAYNPLDYVPFTYRLVIFDGTSESQLRLLRDKMPGWVAEGKNVVLLTTQVNRDDGWGSLARLEDEFKRPVYLLTPDVKNSFRIRNAPSSVIAEGKKFLVTEHKPPL